MNRYMRIALVLGVFMFMFTVMGTSVAYAQSRTWVSGVGDDLNPCSRTAPCKTFAGAHSKTAAGGEISVLDPGGFGCVTITKSITINGEGTLASLLGALVGNCIIINDSATATPGTIFVTLRYLSVNGVGTGVTGINLISGAALIMEHMIVTGFQTGIRSSMGNTTALNTTVVRNSLFGARAVGGTMSFEDSLFANNGIAVQTEGGVTTIRLSNSGFYNNGTAFSCVAGASLASTGDNRKANNVGGGGTVCAPNVVTTVQ